MTPRQFRLAAIQRLTEANAADAVLAASDPAEANAARLRIALRRFPLILLGGAR